MTGRRFWGFVCLVLFSLPFYAAERSNKVILVLVDQENNRAYIPEGTVLPPHLQFNVRVEKRVVDEAEMAQLRGDRDGGKGNARALRKAAKERLHAKAPLVLQYAPAERFENARRNYERQQASRRSRVQTNTELSCTDVYVSDYESGLLWTYFNGFTSTACSQATGIQVGYPATWAFGATGDYSDVDSTIYPHVYVDDDLGNYECLDTFAWPGDGSCFDDAYTVLLQQGCLNDVDTYGQQYVIEYGNNYEPYYVGWGFLVDWCTYHY